MIQYKSSVEKDLRRIDKSTVRRLLGKLEQGLGRNARAGEPLKGDFEGLYKYRVGDYRVIYTQTAEGILVLRIAHRKEVYR